VVVFTKEKKKRRSMHCSVVGQRKNLVGIASQDLRKNAQVLGHYLERVVYIRLCRLK